MSKVENKTIQLLDIWLASYFSLNNIHLKLEVNNSRVVFCFPVSDDLYKLMMKFNSNADVPIMDYITTVKALRGQMLTLRDQNVKS